MPIPRTSLHDARVVDQIKQNLVQLQADMVRNAGTHKQMAQSQSPPLEELAKFITDCVEQYLRRLQWVIDLQKDPQRRGRMMAMINKLGWNESDINDVLVPLRDAAIALRDASRSSYAEIIAACDQLLASVEAPDSLWPE